MYLTVTDELLRQTTSEGLARTRSFLSSHNRDGESRVDTSRLTEADLAELSRTAEDSGDQKLVKAIAAIRVAQTGDYSNPVPNFNAFESLLLSYLKADLIDGWLYSREADGKLYPQAVTQIHYDSDSRNKPPAPRLTLKTHYYGVGDGNLSNSGDTHVFSPGDVSRRRLDAILEAKGLFKETADLKAEYLEQMNHYNTVTRDGFGKQFRFNGLALRAADRYARTTDGNNVKVIHDSAVGDAKPIKMFVDSCLTDEAVETPIHPVIRVFDLATHDFQWVHTETLTPYVYDKTLGEKLILPDTHRDLLDILTTDLNLFTDDIVEGKSAGNIILSKGIPGVGKTLAAEVYAEIIEKPLYKIHSGNLGTTPDQIDEKLKTIFKRAKRWDCVLLLDEADVFVLERGESIEQNAIVAVFLRVLEYFDGLLFMTTNRADEIDEAIISRCIAIISFDPPTREDAKRLWKVMASNFRSELSESLIDQLIDLFPDIVGRDIKMLFRLVLRASIAKKVELDIDLFRRFAMFRAIKMGEVKH